MAIKHILLQRPLSAFFLLTYGISWTLELPALLGHVQRGTSQVDGSFFLFLGSFGPLLAALTLTAASDGRAGLRRLLRRLEPWRAGFSWYLLALYGFMTLGFLAISLLGVASVERIFSQVPTALVNVPARALTTFLVLGPLGEELGWRGYALPRLLEGRSAFSASVLLGLFWALWHAPLMLFPDWRGDMSIGAIFILYPLYIVPLSIIFSWVYIQTGGSVLVTMVLHSAFNYTIFFLKNAFGLARYDPQALLSTMVGLLWLVSLALISVYGPDLHSRRAQP